MLKLEKKVIIIASSQKEKEIENDKGMFKGNQKQWKHKHEYFPKDTFP